MAGHRVEHGEENRQHQQTDDDPRQVLASGGEQELLLAADVEWERTPTPAHGVAPFHRLAREPSLTTSPEKAIHSATRRATC
jgi:hypothetical protein